MDNEKKKMDIQQGYVAPMIIEKKELNIELFSDEPPVEPPWPGP